METIVLTNKQLTNLGSGNNSFTYNFPSSITFKNNEIAISSVSLYYSWYNISAQLGNNVFSYSWTAGVVVRQYNIIIPDGMWEIATINEFLQFQMIQNGTYLIYTNPTTGLITNKFYVEFIVSPSLYSININTFLVPITLPSNAYTQPTNFVGLPTVSFNPTVILPTYINAIFGFSNMLITDSNINNAAVFPPPNSFSKVAKTSAGTISYISTTAPNLQPNSTLLFTLSNMSNQYSNPTNVLYCLTPTCNIGQQFSSNPPKYNWSKLKDGSISQLTLNIIGAVNFMPVQILDPNILIVLSVRTANQVV